jgi:hypothetical protein
MIWFIDTSLQLQPIITAHNRWLPQTRSITYWTTSVFSPTVTDLVLIYESVTSSASVVGWLKLLSWTFNYWTAFGILKVKVTLRLIVIQSVNLGVESHLGFMTRYLLLIDSYSHVFWAPSLTRGRVCLLYRLLALASVFFVGTESLWTRDHILLSQIWEFFSSPPETLLCTAARMV